jgi:hypothetical protein
MGPFGLVLYVLADKEPRPGEHEKFISPLWKQGVGSTIHCVAGDATGIILAAVVTASLGLPMWLDLIIEYLAGFAFGLFIFQALFMQRIMGAYEGAGGGDRQGVLCAGDKTITQHGVTPAFVLPGDTG